MLVRDIMSSPAVSIPPAMTLEDAYRRMVKRPAPPLNPIETATGEKEAVTAAHMID